MIVRKAVPADARAIAVVNVRSWQKAYAHVLPATLLANLSVEPREAFWHEHLAQGDMVVLVAEAEDAVAGWIALGKPRDPDCGSEVWEVYGIYVDPDSWRRGMGRRLFGEARKEHLPPSICALVLWVLEDNPRARAFYEKAGFVLETGFRRMVPIGPARYPEVRYRLSVAGDR